MSINLSEHIYIVLYRVFFTRHKKLFVLEKHTFLVKNCLKILVFLQMFFFRFFNFIYQEFKIEYLNWIKKNKQIGLGSKIDIVIRIIQASPTSIYPLTHTTIPPTILKCCSPTLQQLWPFSHGDFLFQK